MNITHIGFEVLFELCYTENGGLPTLADLRSFLLEKAAGLATSGGRRDLHRYMKLRQELLKGE